MNIDSAISHSRSDIHQVSLNNDTPPNVNRGDNTQDQTLQHRITSRTKDYLMRIDLHGPAKASAMARAAYQRLGEGKFQENPMRTKPVSQYGTEMKYEGQRCILLANFMPHDDQLELVALGLCQDRYFESVAGKNTVDVVILEGASQFPETRPDQYRNIIDTSREAKETQPSLNSKEADTAIPSPAALSEDEIKKARADLAKTTNEFSKHSMRHHMRQMLEKNLIDDGKHPLMATLTSHFKVTEGMLRKGKGRADPNSSGQSSSPPSNNPAITEDLFTPPTGDQYQFKEKEFINFDDFLKSKAVETEDAVSSTENHDLDSTPASPSNPMRHGQLFDARFREELNRQFDNARAKISSSLASSTNDDRADASQIPSTNKRYARVLSGSDLEKLRQNLAAQPESPKTSLDE